MRLPIIQDIRLRIKLNSGNSIIGRTNEVFDVCSSYVMYADEIMTVFDRSSNTDSSKPLIFFSDFDGTLKGEDSASALRSFNKFWLENFYFDKNTKPIYSTGRSGKRFLEFFDPNEDYLLDMIIITSTGSEIFTFNLMKIEYERDEDWDFHIGKNFDAEKVSKSLEKLSWIYPNQKTPHDNRNLYYLLKQSSRIFVDELEKIKIELKNSYGIEINNELCRKSDTDEFYLDINSANAGKGNALKYISIKFGVAKERTYAFGDSLNDISMLTVAAATPSNTFQKNWGLLKRGHMPLGILSTIFQCSLLPVKVSLSPIAKRKC